MRYLPLTPPERAAMLTAIGAASVDELFVDVPHAARLKGPITGLPLTQPEWAVERHMASLAAQNLVGGPCFLGGGAYRHHVPATVDHLIQRGEFLTSYTPYQPEVSQGTLQMLFEFQTQVCLLTGMEVANASMYDGATAAAEAVQMAIRLTGRRRAVLSGNLHPHYRETIETLADLTEFKAHAASPAAEGEEGLSLQIDDQTACLVVQTPDLFGHVRDYTALAAAAHAKGALLIVVVTEIVSLGLLPPPGDMGADIVAAEGQGIGNPVGYGGPYVGLFATREKFIRQMPGRLCGETVDAEGRRGYVLTLSTREQHIRREKATSNICTNAGLCALAFSIHLTLLGERGLRQLAGLNHALAVETAEALAAIKGVELLTPAFFNEFTLRLPKPADAVVDVLAARGVLAGVPVSRFYQDRPEWAHDLLIAVTEMNSEEDRKALVQNLREVLS